MMVNVWYKEYYLPTKRHKIKRERVLCKEADIKVNSPKEEEFPIAFVVSDNDWVIEEENEEPIFKICETEYRAFNGKLYSRQSARDYYCNALGWLTRDSIKKILGNSEPYVYIKPKDAFSEKSIVTRDDFNDELKRVQEKASEYVFFRDEVWREIGEPMYVVQTFGLGHNHGGTSIFVDNYYNPNISKNSYFPADKRAEAIQYAVKVAKSRGDDKSIPEIVNSKRDIKILVPDMVKRNPKKEHGDGDEFLNSLEEIIENSDSHMEAGLGVILKTMMEVV